MTLLTQPWWLYSLSLLAILTLSLICITSYDIIKSKGKLKLYSYPEDTLDQSIRFTITDNPKHIEIISLKKNSDLISSKIFITISLFGAFSYLVSNLPGFSVPVWFHLLIPSFIYGSAAVFYIYLQRKAD